MISKKVISATVNANVVKAWKQKFPNLVLSRKIENMMRNDLARGNENE